MELFGNPESGQAFEEGEDGFFPKSKPFGILGEDCENGLALVGLAMGFSGEGEEGVEDVVEVLEQRPNWILALTISECKRVSGP